MSTIGLDAFLFDVHWDGVFYFDPLRYENGIVYHLRVPKDKKFDYATLYEHLKEHLQTTFYALFFKLPGCQLDVGLKIVEGNTDLEAMYGFCETYGKLDMFLAHIPQNLYEYYYTNLVPDEAVNEERSKLSIKGIRCKHAGNMTYEEILSWAEEEVVHLQSPPKPRTVSRKHWDSVSPSKKTTLNPDNESVVSPDVLLDSGPPDHVDDNIGPSLNVDDENGPADHVDDNIGPSINVDQELPRKFVDKGKAPMVYEDTPVHPKKPMVRNKGIVIGENVNPTDTADSSSDSDAEIPDASLLYDDSDSELSDRSVDYLSDGEEELIGLRRRNSEAKRAPKVRQESSVPNVVEGSSRQKKRDGISEKDTVLEHEEFLDDLLRKLKGCDNDVTLTDPFKMVETNVETYPVYDADTHWKMQKPTVILFVHFKYFKF